MDDTFNEKRRIALLNIAFLSTIVINILASLLLADLIADSPVFQIVVSQVLFILPTVCFLLYTKTPLLQQIKLKKMKLSNIALTVLFGFLTQPLFTFINALSMLFSVNTISSTMVDVTERVPLYVGVLLIAFVPCVFEEVIYRGVFYQEYRKVNPWKAVIFSGFLFGLMHGNLNQFCYAFVMGMIFALLIEATGSILSTMVIHFITNASSVLMIYLYPKLYEMMQGLYKISVNEGQTTQADWIESAMGGDMSLTASEWMHSLFDVTVAITPAEVISLLPSAAFFSMLAFFVYRCIARRSGTWDGIRAMYENRSEEKGTFLTVPMMIAIALGVLLIFVYETLMRLPR